MEQSKIWEHFQNDPELAESGFGGSRPRYIALSRRIRPGSKILNIGTGAGGLEQILVARGEAHVFCLDPDQRIIARMREKLKLGDNARVGSSKAIPFEDGRFDVVVMSEVLEHLEDEVISATLIEVHRVLKPGGRLIGSVPADEHLIESMVICPKCGLRFHRWGHVQSFSRNRLHAVLRSGFGSISISQRYFHEASSLKGKVAWVARNALMALGVHGPGGVYLFDAVAHPSVSGRPTLGE